MVLSKKELGNLIKQARKLKSKSISKKYTQQMLADDIKKSQSYIGDIESGRTYPSYVILMEIARACDVPLSFFQDYACESIEEHQTREPSHILNESKDAKSIPSNYAAQKSKIAVNENSPNYEIQFTDPQQALHFILKQPSFMAYGGYSLDKMTDEEILEIANDMLFALKLSLQKLKKKSK